MIKFFRKIRQNLLAQNKFSRYILYAVGEIVLVVIGILIALQINNWNEWRKERKRETNVLLDLNDNLHRNITLAQNGISEIEEINRSSKIIIRFIEEKIPYSDTLSTHFKQIGRSGSYLVVLNTDGYESYKNIGFEILTSKILKKEVLTLFEVSYKEYENTIEVTNALWGNNPSWWHKYFVNDMELGLIPIDNARIQRNNEVYNNVSALLEQRMAIIKNLEDVISESRKVLGFIEDELRKSDPVN